MNDPFYCELLRANKNNRILIQDFTIYREADYSQLPDKIMGLEAYLKRPLFSFIYVHVSSFAKQKQRS